MVSVCKLRSSLTLLTAVPYRWNRCNQKDEKEVPSMGPMHQLEGDSVIIKALASKYCAPLRSLSREEHSSLRIRVSWPKRLLADEGAPQTFSRADDSKYYVPIYARPCLHAQAQLFASRLEAWEFALLSSNSQNRWFRVSIFTQLNFKWMLTLCWSLG